MSDRPGSRVAPSRGIMPGTAPATGVGGHRLASEAAGLPRRSQQKMRQVICGWSARTTAGPEIAILGAAMARRDAAVPLYRGGNKPLLLVGAELHGCSKATADMSELLVHWTLLAESR